jgi:hypothetical protein
MDLQKIDSNSFLSAKGGFATPGNQQYVGYLIAFGWWWLLQRLAWAHGFGHVEQWCWKVGDGLERFDCFLVP